MNYAQEQRLRFIDCMLVYYGHVSRKEVCDFFGVSGPTATRDFRLYSEVAPDNLVLDRASKAWMRSNSFKRVYQ